MKNLLNNNHSVADLEILQPTKTINTKSNQEVIAASSINEKDHSKEKKENQLKKRKNPDKNVDISQSSRNDDAQTTVTFASHNAAKVI